MGRSEGFQILGQAKLAHRPLELAQSLCIGLDRAVRLALYCAGCEIEGTASSNLSMCNPPLIRWSHITPSCRG